MAEDTSSPCAQEFLLVGSFKGGGGLTGPGLHVFRIEPGSSSLYPVESYEPGLNVGNMVFDDCRNVLYVLDEVAVGPDGQRGGGVYAYAVNPTSGRLANLGRWPSYGTQPAGIALDETRNFLLISHFSTSSSVLKIEGSPERGYRMQPSFEDATTVVFPLDVDGRPGVPCHIHKAGPKSCLHSISSLPGSPLFVECDMANDKITVFAFDPKSRRLELNDVRECPTGSGPRYAACHPHLPIFYVNFEYQPQIEAFEYLQDAIQPLGSTAVLPDSLLPGPGVLLSDLRVHPSGKYAYTLIRGLNAISVFNVGRNGALQRIQTAMLDGESPKGIALSQDGQRAYIAMSVSNEVHIWNVGLDGRLTPTGESVSVSRPSAMLIVRVDSAS